MKKIILFFILVFFLIGSVNATLEGAVFGFGKDMGMSYLSSQNPALGQAISFAMCPQCAVTGQAMSALNEVIPGSSEILNAIQSPEAYVMNQAKQEALTEIYKQLEPEEQATLSNVLNMQPYIEEAFETNPNAPKEQQKGSVEIAENGDTIIKDGEGNIFATIPPGFEAVENKDQFVLINKNAKEDSVLEIKGYKIQADKDSQISFSEKEGIQTINLESGDIQAGDTKILGVEDATIQLNEENQVQFAEFTSKKGGDYVFSYAEKEYEFKAKTGAKILFNPGKYGYGEIKGENTEISFDGNTLDADKFDLFFTGDKVDSFTATSKGRIKFDYEDYEFSSDYGLIMKFDGSEIDTMGVSVHNNEDGLRFNAKGKVKIIKKDKLSYEGTSEDAHVDYFPERNIFDVKSGDSILKNRKREILVKDGQEVILSKDMLNDDSEAQSFGVIVNKKGKEIIHAIDEIDGKLSVIVSKDGKSNLNILPLSKFEGSVSKRIRELKYTKVNSAVGDLQKDLNILIESKAPKKDIDLMELMIIETENMIELSEGDIDNAILSLDNYLYTKDSETGEKIRIPRDLESEFNAKKSLGKLYKEKGEIKEAIKQYESIIRTANTEQNRDKYDEVDFASRFNLGDLYLEDKNYKQARWAYSSMSGDNNIDSISKYGIARVDLISGEKPIEDILKTLDKSLVDNPNNRQAKELKKTLEGDFVLKETIKGLSRQRTQASENFNEYLLGDIDADDGYFSILWKETARGISRGMDIDPITGELTGTSKKLFVEFEGVTQEIDQQQMGVIAMRKLLKEGEVDSIDYFSDKEYFVDVPEFGRMWSATPQQVELRERSLLNKIGNAYSINPDSEEAKGIYYSILYAKDNQDIKLLMDKEYGGANQFARGNYVDLSGLEPGLKNKILSGMDVKNMLAFFGPAATIKVGGKTMSVSKWLLGGARAGVAANYGDEALRYGDDIFGYGDDIISYSDDVARNTIKTTNGALNTFQLAANKFPKSARVLSLIGEEVAESGVGSAVGMINPELGLFTEMLVSRGQVFDFANNILSKGTRSGINTGLRRARVLITESDDVLAIEVANHKQFRALAHELIPNSKQAQQVIDGKDFIINKNGKNIFVYVNPLEDIDETAKKVLKGESTYFEGYTVKGVTKEEISKMPKEWQEVYAESAGVHFGAKKEIHVNLDMYNKLDISEGAKQATIRSTIAHEFFHSKFDALPEIEKKVIIDSFVDHPDFSRMKKVFLEVRPGYKDYSNEKLVNEFIAHAGERKYRSAAGCEAVGYCDLYENFLKSIETEHIARFEIPGSIDIPGKGNSKIIATISSEQIYDAGHRDLKNYLEVSQDLTIDATRAARIRALSNTKRKEFLELADKEELYIYPVNRYGAEVDQAQLFNRKNPDIAKVYKTSDDIGAIDNPIQLKTYKQVKEANVGKVFDLDSHLHDGKFIVNNKPAGLTEGETYIWTIDQNGNFNIGFRAEEGSDLYKFKYLESSSPKSQILSHAVLAEGEPVFGAGEVVFKNGKVLEVNAHSGHYVNYVGSIEFNRNSVYAFQRYASLKGLEFDKNAILNIDPPIKVASQ